MKPRYFQTETAGRDRWMISYMDVLTILLIFFVAIAAHGIPDLQTPGLPRGSGAAAAKKEILPKPEPKSDASPKIQEALASPADSPHSPALLAIKEKLERQQGLDLRIEARGLVISMPQTVLFPSGEDQIGRDALPIVKNIADVLRDLPNRIILVGHADAVPIHNRRFRNNWELSAARGLRLLELLSGRYGIPESRLSVTSDGSYQPKSPNDTPDGRANNRRVEFIIQDVAVMKAESDTAEDNIGAAIRSNPLSDSIPAR
jgi:chemotaxis protein MotB